MMTNIITGPASSKIIKSNTENQYNIFLNPSGIFFIITKNVLRGNTPIYVYEFPHDLTNNGYCGYCILALVE